VHRRKSQDRPAKRRFGSTRTFREGVPAVSWIRTLATPYLRGYHPSLVVRGSLRGYRFVSQGPQRKKTKAESHAGFFVGYLIDSGQHKFLNPAPPECIVCTFLGPVGSPFYEEMVSREGSLLRKTAEYIGWLTHRPPRFTFFDGREMVLTRHFSMREWPDTKRKHYSRNFFIETLAWLVRSGLVGKLREETSPLRPEATPKFNRS